MPKPQTVEELMQTNDATFAWIETPNGRHRIWCKVCRDEGQPWMTPKPCEHVMNGRPQQRITNEEALNTLRELLNEPADQNSPASADPN